MTRLRYNNNFNTLVGDKFHLNSIKFCEAALYIVNEEIIITDDGCYYFKKNAVNGFSPSLTDRTGSEAFHNKLLIDDLTAKKLKPIQRFWCGISVAKELANKLEVLFQTGFIVNLSYNYEHCFIRFYKRREGENLTSENLDEYKEEAILIIEI